MVKVSGSPVLNSGWFKLLLLINAGLVLILIAGAVVSLNLGPYEQRINEAGDKVYGGPRNPGRFVSSLPPVMKTLVHQLDADKEGNFATLVTSANFPLLGVLMILLGRREMRENRISALLWLACGAGMILVGVEELVSLHSYLDLSEGKGEELSRNINGMQEILFFLLPLLLGGLLLIYLIFKTFDRGSPARLLSLLGVMAWLLAIIIDTTLHDLPNNIYRLVGFAEESAEIIGCFLFIFGVELKRAAFSTQISS